MDNPEDLGGEDLKREVLAAIDAAEDVAALEQIRIAELGKKIPEFTAGDTVRVCIDPIGELAGLKELTTFQVQIPEITLDMTGDREQQASELIAQVIPAVIAADPAAGSISRSRAGSPAGAGSRCTARPA